MTHILTESQYAKAIREAMKASDDPALKAVADKLSDAQIVALRDLLRS